MRSDVRRYSLYVLLCLCTSIRSREGSKYDSFDHVDREGPSTFILIV